MNEAKLTKSWFGEYPVEVGQEFDVTFRATVRVIEAELLDVRRMDSDGEEYVIGQTYVTLALSQPRVPLSELEKWAADSETAEYIRTNPRTEH